MTVFEDFEHLTLNTDESYSITLTPPSNTIQRIYIEATTYFGLRHGLETLSQMITWNSQQQAYQIYDSASVLDDAPYYPHRGLSVDTSR